MVRTDIFVMARRTNGYFRDGVTDERIFSLWRDGRTDIFVMARRTNGYFRYGVTDERIFSL
jgi:hypothetical protein